MINFYTSPSNIPSSIKLIEDIEAEFFIQYQMGEKFDSDRCNQALISIEGMKSRVGRVIINKFGETSLKDISTGCKGMLLALEHPELCISNLEMGQNVIEFAIGSVASGDDIHILCKNDIDIPDGEIEVSVDGKQMGLLDAASLILDTV